MPAVPAETVPLRAPETVSKHVLVSFAMPELVLVFVVFLVLRLKLCIIL
jgi:hypothetical protein